MLLPVGTWPPVADIALIARFDELRGALEEAVAELDSDALEEFCATSALTGPTPGPIWISMLRFSPSVRSSSFSSLGGPRLGMLRTTNGVERLHREVRRRARVVSIFPNSASCLRLVSAVLAEISEEWLTGRTYINFEGAT